METGIRSQLWVERGGEDAALMPQLRQAVSGLGVQMQGTPIRRIGEAYDPKA